VVVSSLTRTSSNRIGGSVVVQKSSRQTGEVAVWKLLVSVSREPAGADPVMTLWSPGEAAASSAAKNASRLPPRPAPAAGGSPRYSATTPVSYGGWNSSGPISNV
jgi:hypothetical protein